MKKHLGKRLLSLALCLALCLSLIVPVSAAGVSETPLFTVEQVDNSTVTANVTNREPAELQDDIPQYADTDMVRVSIVLEQQGTIEAGFAPQDIAANTSAMSYRDRLKSEQAAMTTAISGAIHTELDVVWNLTLAANIISANVMYGDIQTIEAVPGVKSVLVETCYEVYAENDSVGADPYMSTSGQQIGSTAAWAAGYTGAGSRIAIIDTGTDIDHISFDADAYAYSLSLQAEKAGMETDKYIASLNLLDADEIAKAADQLNAENPIQISSKLPYGYNYVDKNTSVNHASDVQGAHGSHVAGIAAANAYVPNDEGGFDRALDSVYVQGVAPDAQLLTMKVFGLNGGVYDSDYMAALEDAIVLECDAVNMSFGTPIPGPTQNSEPLYQSILESLVDTGVVISIASGNSSYWAEQSKSGNPYLYLEDVSMQMNGVPGTFTNSLNVASVNNDGYALTACIRVGNKVISFVDNSSIDPYDAMTTLAGEQEFVFLNNYGSAEQWDALGIDLTGKIAICYRGLPLSFYEKANAAVERGAIGVIICNNVEGEFGMNLAGYNYTAPAVAVTQDASYDIIAAGTPVSGDGVEGWIGTMEIVDGLTIGQYNSAYYTMSDFSSWGIPGSLELKPEITAPGGNVYSIAGSYFNGTDMTDSDHASYNVQSGTSMAAPQITGMSAVVAQYVRENGLAEKTGLNSRALVQSLLMSTSVPLRDAKSNGNYYSILQQGSGLANVGSAVSADSYILMGKDATTSFADGKVKAELGDDPDKIGEYSFSFTINNLTAEEKTFLLSADVFTQNRLTVDGVDLLDTKTTSLAPMVTWTADGAPVENANADSLRGKDFNGDGNVTRADGQALLDYATGVRTELTNADQADLDADGNIDSYDAYLFFSLLSDGNASVPANGSTEITVTIRLTDADKEQLAVYPNGAYIEAYVYAESLPTDEGVSGTTHSIPVIGFYGNWSDPSMFDKGSFVEYFYGMDVKTSYLYDYTYSRGNYKTFTVDFGGRGTPYHFGGNPVMEEEEYLPERNAISSVDGTTIAELGFTSIRYAADSYLWLKDTDSGEYYLMESLGAIDPAFFYVNQGSWMYTYWKAKLGFTLDGIAEDTALELGLTLVPEYYVRDGKVYLDELGAGVSFTMPMVVDNTAPTIDVDSISLDLPSLTLDVTDNRYVAGVYLLNGSGDTVLSSLNPNQTEEGVTTTVTLDVLNAVGAGKTFLLQVYDFAMNATTYQVTLNMLPDLDTHYMFFDMEQKAWYGYTADGSDYALMGWCNLDIVAADYVDGYVFAFDEDCNFYVMEDNDFANYTYITTAADDGPMDPEYFCEITDMAYNPVDDKMYFLVWSDYNFDYPYLYTIDLFTGSLELVGEMGEAAYTLAIDDEGTFYSQDALFSDMYTFTLDSYDSPDWVGSLPDELSIFYTDCALTWDNAKQKLVFTFYDNGVWYGTGKIASIFLIDPVTLNTRELAEHENLSAMVGAYVRNGEPDPTRFAPTDKAAFVALSAYEYVLGVGVNDTVSLTATVQPWNLTDHSVVWTSSNESVATVDDNGNVQALDLGTATITATSTVDPTVSASCVVTVQGQPLSLTGILQNADRDSKFFSWNMEENATWRETGDLDTSIVSATYDRLNEKIYVMDYVTDSWDIHVVDPATGVTEATYENTAGIPLWDMEYSTVFSTAEAPVIHGVYSNYLLIGQDPTALGTTAEAFDLTPYLQYAWGRFVVGVASAGYYAYEYNGVVYDTELLLMIDDMGGVISVWVYQNEDGTYGAFADASWCDMMFNFDGWRQNVVGSMIVGSDGKLYIAAFNGRYNELYSVDVNDGNYVIGSTLVGTFGADVWPVILLDVSRNGIGTANVSSEPASTEAQNPVSGSLNSTATVAEDQTTVSVKLTAKDAQGTEVDATNGVQTVTYDPGILELTGVTVNGDYFSVNRQDDEGKVTIGYVNMNGISAGDPTALLEFKVIGSADTNITVNHAEVNADDLGSTETLRITLTGSDTPATVAIAGTTMTLGNDLALNFMVKTTDVTGEGWYAEIVHGDNVTTIAQSDWVNSGDYTRISYNGLAAKQMVDEVVITIYDAKGNELATKTDSIRAYAMRMFGKSKPAFDTVLADMLNYGAAAQLQFNYKTNDLANSQMTEEQKAKATASVAMTNIRETAEGYLGTTLELESNILLNFFYSADYAGKTATVSYTDHYGVTHNYNVEIAASGTYGKVSVDKLVISDCSVAVTVTVDGVSVVDSVESYCARMTDLALREPLMKFAASARTYFGS